MIEKTRVIFTILIISICSKTYATGSRTTFLSHGPSVEAYGRGDTGTAYLDSIASVFYNPSLAANLKTYGFESSYYSLFEESMYSFAGVGVPIGKSSYLALSGICLRSGNVDIRQNIDSPPQGIRTSEWAGFLTFSRKLSWFDLGLNLKYVGLMLYDHNGSGLGMDMGVSKQFEGPIVFDDKSRVNVGLTAQNLVRPAITLISDQETYEPIYRLGLSFSIPVYSRPFSYDSLGLYSDIANEDNNLNYYSGLEYIFCNKLALRGGYYKGNITSGASLSFANFKIDYAVDFVEYTTFHRFGLSWSFWRKDKISDKNIENLLMKEARSALKQNMGIEAEHQKEITTLFRSAKRYFKSGKYLTASDKFGELILKYPDYENAVQYFNKINTIMENDSKDNDSTDMEKVSYAKGYIFYKEQKFNDALNEWEKVLQINPKAEELKRYSKTLTKYLNDAAVQQKEIEIEKNVKELYDSGLNDFNASKWVSCIKKMEEISEICKKEQFSRLVAWQGKANDLLEKALKELSTVVNKKHDVKTELKVKEPEIEVNTEGAKKKYNDGLILYAQGKISDAIKMWEITIRLDPNYEKAYKALENAKEELNSSKK